jgi:hypothetical protein
MQYRRDVASGGSDEHDGHSHSHAEGAAHSHRPGESCREKEKEKPQSIAEQLRGDHTHELEGVDFSTLEVRDANGFVALHYAALDERVALVVELLRRHPQQASDNNNVRKQTPLHWAAMKVRREKGKKQAN